MMLKQLKNILLDLDSHRHARKERKQRKITCLQADMMSTQIILVSLEVRTAHLIEFLAFSLSEISDIVRKIKQIDGCLQHISALSIDGNIFIVKLPQVLERIYSYLIAGTGGYDQEVLLVRVDEDMKIPTVAEPNVYEELAVILCRFQGIIERFEGNANSVEISSEELCLGTVGLVGFAGWLLGYPFVYCCQQGPNCLGEVPLRVLTVSLQRDFCCQKEECCQQKDQNIMYDEATCSEELCSFSIPDEIYCGGNHSEILSRFLRLIEQKVENNQPLLEIFCRQPLDTQISLQTHSLVSL